MNTYILYVPSIDTDETHKVLKDSKLSTVIYCGTDTTNKKSIWTIKCNQDDLPWVLLKTNGTIR